MYLKGLATEDGHSEVEVRLRIQAGANGWRRERESCWTDKISKNLKEKVLRACVTPACLNGL